MDARTQLQLIELNKAEGFDLKLDSTQTPIVIANGKTFPLMHPYSIQLMLYRDETDPELKFQAMKRVHHMLWPQYVGTWHSWTEDRFRAHCEGYKQIILASGASSGKSVDAALIAFIFYLSDPMHNACVIASTTLESLESRIWGYITKYMKNVALPIAAKLLTSKPPKIIYPGQVDKIHGMFAVANKQGEDDQAISNLIGRHPDKRILVVLDEATDMNAAITRALPNLEKGVDFSQVIAIGNSKSRHDLHGALATPKNGWDSIDWKRDDVWETTHANSVCLYFNPYKSPAITDPDPEKRKALSRFLITEEGIEHAKHEYNEESDAFWRFCLGFWKPGTLESTILSEQFLREGDITSRAEWSGFHPLEVVAGLDPAFQVGGTGCVLRLGLLGHLVDGSVALDFRESELLFYINIQSDSKKSGERQIAEKVLEILQYHGCPLRNLALDATGVGRALGELMAYLYYEMTGDNEQPMRVVSVRPKKSDVQNPEVDPHIIVLSPSDIWLAFRNYLPHKQIKGLDSVTSQQLTNRLVIAKNGKLILESKSEFIARMSAIHPSLARSPDEADGMMLALTIARLRRGFAPGKKIDTDQANIKFALQTYRSLQQSAQAPSRARPPMIAGFAKSLEDSLPTKRQRE